MQLIGFGSAPLGAAWHDGSCHGAWCSVHDGFGTIQVVETSAGTHALALSPRAASAPNTTYSSLVRTRRSWKNVDFTVRVRTVAQRRTGVPNPWEVGWVLWHYSDNRHFYYFIAKPNGWELGKEDPAYPGSQRFLADSSRPRFPTGRTYRIRVRHVANTITVWVDNKRIIAFADDEHPYRSGSIALYSEDAAALYSPIEVRSP